MRDVSTELFWQWFGAELHRRGFRSVRQVELSAGVGGDTISYRYRHGMDPTDTIIRAIAQAFGMTFENVQGIAYGARPVVEPPQPTANLTLRELWDLVSGLPIDEQRAVLEYALYRKTASETQRRRGARQGSPAASETGN